MECDQEIIVPESIWLECEGGRMLRRDLYATCVNRQLQPFKPAVAGLRYFISYYFDLGDISPWGGSTSAPISNQGPLVRMMPRSRTFSSSRTLPGQA